MSFGGYSYEQIQALSDIDFDALARSSLPFLDPNAYPWDGHEETDDDRVATIRKRVLKISTNPEREAQGAENFIFIQKHFLHTLQFVPIYKTFFIENNSAKLLGRIIFGAAK